MASPFHRVTKKFKIPIDRRGRVKCDENLKIAEVIEKIQNKFLDESLEIFVQTKEMVIELKLPNSEETPTAKEEDIETQSDIVPTAKPTK